jgi:hypothetical protein
MVHLSSKSKQAIVQKVLSRDNSSSIEQIAKTHNIGYSTLQRWVKDYRTGNLPAGQPGKKQAVKDVSLADKFSHLMATASLDDVKIGSYCRQHGLFGFQLQQWKESFMTNTNEEKQQQFISELQSLRAENLQLRREVRRKDSALAETAALLVLQKKTALIWGGSVED